ncbi:HD domain-containing protein [Desulfobulbus sp.]|uniref:HD domain-containing protein n=1 Tax=Desulfobulbus sp. TaxID=895 RepID=UPI0027B9CD30|nr:HD domain-containing protein [Desulfobulbus sp.]
MNDLVSKARNHAVKAHAHLNHRRKYSLEPYDVHLQRVAELVASVTDDPEMIAAAWLHDTVEDTAVTLLDLEQQFGPAVAQLVGELTDVSRPSDGNRATRRAIDRAHLAKASQRGKTIKLADLIDNSQDICAHDPEFAKVYLTEMASLLEVLTEGEPALYEQAMTALRNGAETLRLPLHVVGDPAAARPAQGHEGFLLHRMADLFRQTFTARNIARALPSVDHPPAETALAIMERHNLPVIGIREAGVVRGYVARDDLQRVHPFAPGQVLADSASFSEIILVLSRHTCCFVRILDAVSGIIVKDDIQHPYMRMWLFGVITMMEMETGPMIERLWPNDAWKSLVSPGRLAKAEALLEERTRRNQRSTVLACLQFSDKMQMLIEDEQIFETFGFPSKKAARAVCKDLESLRNNLAHAQDIVTHDFTQVARIAQRIESVHRNQT